MNSTKPFRRSAGAGLAVAGALAVREFWITATIARTLAWSVYLDSGHDVGEFEETDNSCSPWANDT